MKSLFTPRIGLADNAQLCRRLGLALASGIEVRRVIEREASNSLRPVLRSRLRTISDAVDRGEPFDEALALTDDYFPPIMHEMVRVAEQTGHLAEVFKHLADHYEEQLRVRRSFMSSIALPMMQLGASLIIISLMILVMGMLPRPPGGQPIDMLGLGLTGISGFIAYWIWVAMIGCGIYFVIHAARRGVAWTEPLQKLVLRIPGVGNALRTISLGNMAWTLDLTLDAGMSLLKSLPLALDSTQNAYYRQHTADVVRGIRSGREIHEVLTDTGAFPFEFLAAVEVGERSGNLPEAMKRLAADYLDRARSLTKALAAAAGYSVWAIIALFIVFVIIRLASNTIIPYYNTVYELSQPGAH